MRGSLGKSLYGGVALAGLLAAASVMASQQVETFQGVARDEQGAVVYVEDHRLVYENGRLRQNQTRYLDAAGREFATLRSTFASHPYLPDYRFEDRRFGREDGARARGDAVYFYGRESDAQTRRESAVPLRNDLVTGQGLHFFIRDQLPSLARGEVKQVDFLVPLDGDYYRFRIMRNPAARDPAGVLTVRIESDSWLARLVAPTIDVQYELATRRLLSYKGVSNLLSNDKSVQNVVIAYRYGDSS